MAGNVIESSADTATQSSWPSGIEADALEHSYRKPETNFVASGSDQLPELDAVALVQQPETETSDGDQNSKERRRHRRRRKYGRLKRIRLEGSTLTAADAATESESEKRFIVVDGPQVGIFRSPTSSPTMPAAPDNNGRSWFGRKLINRKRKSASKRKPRTSKSTKSTTAKSEKRCEYYLKHIVAALFSTLGLLCLMVAYTILGGYVFCQLEYSNEVSVKEDMRQVTMLYTSVL